MTYEIESTDPTDIARHARAKDALELSPNELAQDVVDLLIAADHSRARLRRLERQLARYVPPLSYREYLATEAWGNRRAAALTAAGHRCQVCNTPDGESEHHRAQREIGQGLWVDNGPVQHRLHVHHRTYERFGNEDAGDLVVLCEACHEVFHQRRRLWRPDDPDLKTETDK